MSKLKNSLYFFDSRGNSYEKTNQSNKIKDNVLVDRWYRSLNDI